MTGKLKYKKFQNSNERDFNKNSIKALIQVGPFDFHLASIPYTIYKQSSLNIFVISCHIRNILCDDRCSISVYTHTHTIQSCVCAWNWQVDKLEKPSNWGISFTYICIYWSHLYADTKTIFFFIFFLMALLLSDKETEIDTKKVRKKMNVSISKCAYHYHKSRTNNNIKNKSVRLD